jgi:uncharacterized protein (TIGR03118 family)
MRLFAVAATALLMSSSLTNAALACEVCDNRYTDTRLVGNKVTFKANRTEKKLINAWGIAIRPAGAGGHFWVTGKDVSFEYVGDVKNSPDSTLRSLHTDGLKYVRLPVGGSDNFATGVTFSGSKEHFVITQEVKDAAPITAPAKFLFASDGGIVSAWTERKKGDGSFDWPTSALSVIDRSDVGSQFFGITTSHDYTRLYVADFGQEPAVRVYDGSFTDLGERSLFPVQFDQPFDENKNGKVDAGEYAPFNVQALTTPAGEHRIFVTYAKTQACPKDEVKKGTCNEGEIFAGEEDTSQPGYGKLAEFDESGALVAVWNDGGKLSAPWGITYAPADFGAMSGKLLVGNFGDGTISAYDANTREFVDVLRKANGKPVVIDKLWGLLFGNGMSLGDSNALYYAAGPNDEKDGIFGSLRPAKVAK